MSKQTEVTELCPHCDREVTIMWNLVEDGLKAFCPYCGNRLMLCAYCPATDPESSDGCDYSTYADSCRYNPPKQANTKIHYLYRDASNYKIHNEVIIPGILTDQQESQIKNSLDEGEYFIPHLVGLPEHKFEEETEDDHPFFEFLFVKATCEKPTENISVEELVAAFLEHTGKWS